MYTTDSNIVIFEDRDIFDTLYQNNNVAFEQISVLDSTEISNLIQVSGLQFNVISENNLEIQKNDKERQQLWFIPPSYKNLNIRKWVIQQCNTSDEIIRANQELVEFEKRNMVGLLQWLKYFVDSCISRNIIIGVGRGSSVSSFVLYKIGVHKIDSLKYNLDWREFLR